jgi:nucleoside 2-deoxyribosyltransferase
VNPLKVYLAAPFAARDALRPFADELSVIGMECTSGWLLGETDIATGEGAAVEQPAEAIRQEALADLRAVGDSDCIVQFTGLAIEAMRVKGQMHSGGRHVELGYALARNRKAIVIGHPENIFQRTLCTPVLSWHEAVLQLCKIDRERRQPMFADVAVSS